MNFDKPIRSGETRRQWGSDYLAEIIRALDLKYLALNPGSSYRGLHDSLVNHLGNADPQMLVCLHEEHAVAIAHGYAKVTGRPMGVAVHSNVGLMHATMAIYNAWCDRVPMLIFGATGPVDAASRRPWIDWIHTSRDQGALIRNFIKWDDQPASLAAAAEGLMRGHMIARTAPCGPVYFCFDVSLQEAPIAGEPPLPDVARFQPPAPPAPSAADVAQLADLLEQAQNPLLLIGRVNRDTDAWGRRVELAERLNVRVLTDLKTGASFPTDHPLHADAPATFTGAKGLSLVRESDLVVSLDWVDLGGTLKLAYGAEPVAARVVQCSLEQYLHNGWSTDHQGLAPVDLTLLADPDRLVAMLLDEVRRRQDAAGVRHTPAAREAHRSMCLSSDYDANAAISVRSLSIVMKEVLGEANTTLIRLPLGWAGDSWDFRHPLDYLGQDGGAGLGSGTGMAVGAALALQDSGRLPVAVLGDGDFMMGCNGLWTAARHGIPLLVVVANNQSFFNDEVHQERVARQRARPVENKWIGQRIAGPDIDIAKLAEAQGAVGIGPVASHDELRRALALGVEGVRAGRLVVIDARVQPGYDQLMAKGLTREINEKKE